MEYIAEYFSTELLFDIGLANDIHVEEVEGPNKDSELIQVLYRPGYMESTFYLIKSVQAYSFIEFCPILKAGDVLYFEQSDKWYRLTIAERA